MKSQQRNCEKEIPSNWCWKVEIKVAQPKEVYSNSNNNKKEEEVLQLVEEVVLGSWPGQGQNWNQGFSNYCGQGYVNYSSTNGSNHNYSGYSGSDYIGYNCGNHGYG
ncbi:hypothetical protein TREES_T100005330 [Tupaia chinensis]|uniref:Uncharacterized protein n=1 Tax=Tupaia chinensis TaxID=246437 RepID=L9KT84_TUPCH|nr:hypothetical protein TREES_T100005330 [Tupaia chinensis]